jgi:hypothetical protein
MFTVPDEHGNPRSISLTNLLRERVYEAMAKNREQPR